MTIVLVNSVFAYKTGGKGHSWMNRTPMILSNYRRSILLEQDFAFPLADSLSILDLLVHA